MPSDQQRAARLLAYYLPQFHPIPENDAWWGKGFTEWSNVVQARPLFKGHHQPSLPSELGFYDLRVPETRLAQADLARSHGIEGFCYWHYWFGGKRLLERPLREVVRSGKPDFPFCLAWANQSWSGVWHGAPDRVLMEQTYPGPEDDEAHFTALLDVFGDRRYLAVDGRPIFIVFRPQELPDARRFTDCWRELAEKSGLRGIYFIAVSWSREWDSRKGGFDAEAPNNFNLFWNRVNGLGTESDGARPPEKIMDEPLVVPYEEAIRFLTPPLEEGTTRYPSVFPCWDNTPRAGKKGRVLLGSTPELFGRHLGNALAQVCSRRMEERIVFVKSWNEWAEGNYLEPDKRFGRAYLETVRDLVVGEDERGAGR